MSQLLDKATELGILSSIQTTQKDVSVLAGIAGQHVFVLILRKKKLKGYRLPKRSAERNIPNGRNMRSVGAYVRDHEKDFKSQQIKIGSPAKDD